MLRQGYCGLRGTPPYLVSVSSASFKFASTSSISRWTFADLVSSEVAIAAPGFTDNSRWTHRHAREVGVDRLRWFGTLQARADHIGTALAACVRT